MRKLIFIGFIASLFCGCNDDLDDVFFIKNNNNSLKAVIPESFDWEKDDWMPTPSGQTKISMPWIGQGSIASLYDNDVLYDYKKVDGWELLYSTFTKEGNAPIKDPYFILYNKYRGTLRIYLYVTTEFISQSSYLQDGLNIVGDTSRLLQFAGSEIVKAGPFGKNLTFYSQIQPRPRDGSMPLATNKWHMLEYEMAYDPNLSNWQYDKTQLSWYLNYCNITEMNFNGTTNGEINSVVGSISESNVMSSIGDVGVAAGTMGLSAIGSKWIENRTTNSTTYDNKLKLSPEIWKKISEGAHSAISGATEDLPGTIINLLSAIIGIGNTDNQPNLNFKVQLETELKGTGKGSGSFPSSPTSFWVPGTIMNEQTQGYIPIYNKPLGVFSFKTTGGKINLVKSTNSDGTITYKFEKVNFTKYIDINPYVDADIECVSQDIICSYTRWFGSHTVIGGTTEEFANNPFISNNIYVNPEKIIISKGGLGYFTILIRVKMKVKPHDGSNPVYIIKSVSGEQSIYL